MQGVFEALGEPVRRLILELLAPGEQPAGELVAALQSRVPISQPAVSQHLKVLREASLVSVRAAGTRRLYALDEAGLDAAQAWLARLADPMGQFAQPLDALATELARGQRARRAARAGHHQASLPERQAPVATGQLGPACYPGRHYHALVDLLVTRSARVSIRPEERRR